MSTLRLNTNTDTDPNICPDTDTVSYTASMYFVSFLPNLIAQFSKLLSI